MSGGGNSGSDLAYMPVFVDEDAGKTYQIVVEESEAQEANAGTSKSGDNLLSEAEQKCNTSINILQYEKN